MGKMDGKQKWKTIWLSLTIKKKIQFFIGTVFCIVFLSILFNIWVVSFSVNDFQVILEDNAKNIDFVNAIEAESNSFAAYIKNPSEERQKNLEDACSETKRTILRLPYNYVDIGAYRYAKTWSILNGYQSYEQKRDTVLKMEEENPDFVKALYQVYDMQVFLQEYARTLMTFTLQEGTNTYIMKLPYLKGVLIVVLFFGMILFFCSISLTSLMNKTILLPIIKLVKVSKSIAANDFYVADVEISNQDEMGELVKAFNKMKNGTGQYIKALEEKREMAHLLYQEELEKLEIEKRLEVAKFELIKNQIKPHFLFNTLNVIGGMARLEEAKNTQQMIKSLSSLFRYNLKTPEAEVAVEQELQVIRDYMYLQQMRFGSRVGYQIECKVDASTVKLPTFSFQPLIENAIIHGLSKKEEGGRIYIRIWKKGKEVIISVADTGMGMTEEKLEQLKKAFKQGITEDMGIGLGNIYTRINTMYPGGNVEIFSKENIGTVIRLTIPQIG